MLQRYTQKIIFKGVKTMLPKIEKPNFSGGFLGEAETTKQAPYREVERTPDMFPDGEKSMFVSPKNEEDRKKYPKGIKR